MHYNMHCGIVNYIQVVHVDLSYIVCYNNIHFVSVKHLFDYLTHVTCDVLVTVITTLLS